MKGLAAQFLQPISSVNKLSEHIARRIWWTLLWLVRRPAMKKTQRLFTALLPGGMGQAAYRSQIRQNALARRIGLKWLTGVVSFFLVTVAFTGTYQAALLFVQSSVVHTPQRMVDLTVSPAN